MLLVSIVNDALDSVGQTVGNHSNRDHRSNQIDDELDAIVPDYTFDSAETRIDNGCNTHEQNAQARIEIGHLVQNQARQVQTQSICNGAREHKDQRRGTLRETAEPLMEYFVSGQNFAAKIAWHETSNYDQSPEHKSDRQLQETTISSCREYDPWNTEKGYSAGLRCNDGTQYGIPRKTSITDQEAREIGRPTSNPNPKKECQ